MKRLDRFILKAFVGPFAAVLLVVVFILMMQFLWLYIDELVGKGLSLGVIMEFMMWGACTILPLAMPLSTLLASVMTLGQMGENNELIAIKASGVSLTRIMLPLIVAASCISFVAFLSGNFLVPKAYNEIYTLRDDIGRTKSEIKIPSGTFYDGIDGYILRVENTSSEGMMYDVMVYDHTGNKGNTALMLADSSTLKMSKGKDYLIFDLYSGSNYQETNNYSVRDTSRRIQRIDFDHQQLVIPLKNYSFEKSDSSRFGDQIKSQGIAPLVHLRDSLVLKTEGVLDNQYLRFRTASDFYLHQQIDTSVHRGATQMFEHPGLSTWKKRSDRISAVRRAVDKAQMMESTISAAEHETYEYDFYLRRARVEILKKFAQALACFILFFIGAPLGALIGKGGLGANVIVSVLFFVLYWVIDISGTKLANDGAATAAVGAFTSTIVLSIIGGFLTWKAVNDSPLFNMDALKTWWKGAKSRVARIFHKTRIVYMGTPDFAVAPLDALIKGGYNVVGVVTVADKPSGRGLKVNESAVKKYAVEHGLPVLQPVKLKDPEFLAQLRAMKADMFVVVAFRMLPEEVWSMPKLGTFNLHAALLPQYRGAAPINWAVINGERHTGVTTFMIDKDIDTGGILFREECRIAHSDTAGDVHDRLMEMGSSLVVQTVEALIQHNVETRVQRSFIQGSEVLKPAPKLTRELCHIDWNDTTSNIYNLIRGLSPYPTAYTELVKEGSDPVQLKIFFGEEMDASAPAGTVLTDGKTYFAIATSDGAISVKDLQLSGKKRMDVSAFLLGFRDASEWKAVSRQS